MKLSVNDGVLHLDMDGVVAGFEQWSLDVIGQDWKPEIDKPDWGDFKKYPRLYRDLPLLEGALDLYKLCCDLYGKDKVIMLTALPNRARDAFPNAAEDKIFWARKYLSEDARVSFGPFAKDKKHHCRHRYDVLIDDTYLNTSQWTEVGGFSIMHSHEDMASTITKLTNFKKGILE